MINATLISGEGEIAPGFTHAIGVSGSISVTHTLFLRTRPLRGKTISAHCSATRSHGEDHYSDLKIPTRPTIRSFMTMEREEHVRTSRDVFRAGLVVVNINLNRSGVSLVSTNF